MGETTKLDLPEPETALRFMARVLPLQVRDGKYVELQLAFTRFPVGFEEPTVYEDEITIPIGGSVLYGFPGYKGRSNVMILHVASIESPGR